MNIDPELGGLHVYRIELNKSPCCIAFIFETGLKSQAQENKENKD